jgi:hypothetical protein
MSCSGPSTCSGRTGLTASHADKPGGRHGVRFIQNEQAEQDVGRLPHYQSQNRARRYSRGDSRVEVQYQGPYDRFMI